MAKKYNCIKNALKMSFIEYKMSFCMVAQTKLH